MFFTVSANSDWNTGAPRAAGIYGDLEVRSCKSCRRRLSRLSGPATVDIDDGNFWTDAVAVAGNPSFIVSERVVDGLYGAGIGGFEEQAVEISENRSKRLRILAQPKYYYLRVTGAADIDLHASVVNAQDICPSCFNSDETSQPQRLVVKADTWDGGGLFVAQNFPSGPVFCSDSVLELARAERWSNFRFNSADLLLSEAVRWGGIDYLGARWPPSLSPKSPSAGKSIEEWIEQLLSDDVGKSFKARRTLVDLGLPAAPYVARLLSNESDFVRRQAAIMLYGINRKTPIEPQLLAAIRPYLEPHFLAALDSDGTLDPQ